MGNTGNVTALFLQARLDSSRLPRKALLNIQGKTILSHAMESLKRVKADVHVLLTDRESRDELSVETAAEGFEIFSGPRDDVLARFMLAADRYGASTIIRSTGDNPLVSPVLADLIYSLHAETGADYSGFSGIPLGMGVEIIRTEALRAAYRQSVDPYEREHVCPYLYRREDQFTVYRPEAPEEYLFPEGRVTLDTREDFEYLKTLYADLYEGKPIPAHLVVKWLKSHQRIMV